jgi:adenosine deaminase
MIDRSLPLTDLHRHLDGNIRPQTILELGRQHNIRLPADELEALRPHVQIVENEPSLVAFLKKLDWGVAVLADYDACRRVAYENVEDLLRAGIDYAELRFSPAYMAMTHKLHPQGVVEAIIDGVAAGSRDFGIKTNLIGIMSRTFGTEQCKQEVKMLLIFSRKSEALQVYRIIYSIDPNAFVSQGNVNTIYGEGFDKSKVKAKIRDLKDGGTGQPHQP